MRSFPLLSVVLLLWSASAQSVSFPFDPSQLPALPTSGRFTLPSLPTDVSSDGATWPTLSDLDPDRLKDQATKEPSKDDPAYKLLHILSLPDQRLGTATKGKWPLVEVIDTTNLATWQKSAAACRQVQEGTFKGKTPPDCPQYEWTVPFSLESESKDAGTGIRQAWQRFEERYWWRTQTSLNNATLVPLFCWAGINMGGLSTRSAQVQVTNDPADVPAPLSEKVPTSTPQNKLYLDDYWPLPQVSASDFCDGLSFNPALMYFPGGCLYLFGVQLSCVQGNSPVTGPGVSPIWFNSGEASRRVQSAMAHAATTYYPQYQADALKELLPPKRKALFVLPWRSHLPGDGAIIAPVLNASVKLQPYLEMSKTAADALGSIYKPLSPLYYFQNVKHIPALALLGLPGRKDLVGSPPTAWKFEEFKRNLPPTNPAFYDQFGYVTFFQTWNQFDTTIVPEPLTARPLRTLTFAAAAIDTYIDWRGVTPVPNPTAVLVPPYNLPFAGYRLHYTWASVPDGYEIPRVQGLPAFDYDKVVR